MHALASWWISLWITALSEKRWKHELGWLSDHAPTSLNNPDDSSTPRRFFLQREVEIRPVAWKKGSVELLQIYKAKHATTDPIENRPRMSATDLVAMLNDSPRTPANSTTLVRDVNKLFGEETILSRSAQVGLGQWTESLPDEKLRLCSKMLAEFRAQQPVDPFRHLRVLYLDEHICVVEKPSGILSVPGVQRNPSLLDLVHNLVQPSGLDTMDQMVVHRLDMDTSGIVVFALSKKVAKQLHDDFRHRNVHKEYEALLSGWISAAPEVDIQLDLERDPHHLPFMRIAQPRTQSTDSSSTMVPFLKQSPKPSWTELRVLQRTTTHNDYPVTRVQLIAHTGRTHQLRVHTAALGYPILGDDIYGYSRGAEGSAGGLAPSPEQMEKYSSLPASRLCLHARRLALRHPVSGEPMMFACPAPF